MKIIPLSEGSFTVDASKAFIPFQLSEDELTDRNRGSLLVEIQPFVVITQKDILLLDTGLGFQQDGKMQLVQNLSAVGLQTGDITKVLMSHLHKDHIGGMVHPQTGEPVFENAQYYIQAKELAYAQEHQGSSYDIEKITPVLDQRVQILQDVEGEIEGSIRYQVTGAHSPFHQVFWITENDQTLFFGADDAPQLQQMKHRFAAKYDFDGKKAMELRTQWWQQGQQEDWTFLFYHDTKTPIVRPRVDNPTS